MLDFRKKNRLFLVKTETTPGTDPTPTPASDAVRVVDSTEWNPDLALEETNYVQESLSTSAPVAGGGSAGDRSACWLTGAGTAGIAPDWGKILLIAGFQETLTAADVTGTAQAGASGSITLAAGASATDDLYKGMPLEVTGGTGPTTTLPRVITGYNGTTKVATVTPAFTVTPDNTSVYAIRANARYVPISQGLKTGTVYDYNHGTAAASQSRLSKVLGAMAQIQLRLTTARLARIEFTLTGQLPAAPTDVSKPATATYVGANPEAFRAAQCYLNGAAFKLNELTFDLGNTLAQFDDPAQAFARDTCDITNRNSQGRLAAAAVYTATRDAVTDLINGTTRSLWLNWGSAVGKRVSILMPAIRYTGREDVDIQGFAAEGLPFRATGLDQEIYISAW